jgi:hypothetical protein
MKTVIKFALAVILFIALARLPYGYYEFARLVACVAFIYFAYAEFQRKQQITGIACMVGAILFNPIFKIHLPRETWQGIDVIIAILLLVWAFSEKQKS